MTVFDYSDYRLFLHHAFLERKKHNQSFSLRYVAFRLGCNPGFLTKIMKGKRNLSSEYALKTCKLLGLGRKEREYFQLLVSYNQAKRQLEREHYFEKLRTFKNSRIRKVSERQYSLYEHWYNVVLRELINIIPCYDTSYSTCSTLASHIVPHVKVGEIQKSMNKLLQLGIVEKRAGGRLWLSDKLITTGMNIPKVIVQKVLLEFFRLGKEAMDRFRKPQRVCATVTVSASKDAYEQIKTRLEQCRKEILEIVHGDEAELDRVYHVNMQLFPVSKSYNKGNSK